MTSGATSWNPPPVASRMRTLPKDPTGMNIGPRGATMKKSLWRRNQWLINRPTAVYQHTSLQLEEQNIRQKVQQFLIKVCIVKYNCTKTGVLYQGVRAIARITQRKRQLMMMVMMITDCLSSCHIILLWNFIEHINCSYKPRSRKPTLIFGPSISVLLWTTVHRQVYA